MTKFRKLILAILALLVSLAPVVAFAGGRSESPNPPNYKYPQFLVDYISADAAGDAILDEVRTLIWDFRVWQDSPGAALPNMPRVDARSVVPGANYNVGLQHAAWTGTFATCPVGNQNSAIWPILTCATPPCSVPGWLLSYTGPIMSVPTDPTSIADTAFSTIAFTQMSHTVQVSTAHAAPCYIEESSLNSTNNPRNVSGRKLYINPTIWPTLSANAKFSWVNRCLLLALNTPLSTAPASTVTLLHPTEPDVLSAVPIADRNALATAWATVPLATSYGYPMPASLAPVP